MSRLLKDMTIKELAKWLEGWNDSRVKEINSDSGKLLTDINVLAPIVKSLVSDLTTTMNILGILLDKLSNYKSDYKGGEKKIKKG